MKKPPIIREAVDGTLRGDCHSADLLGCVFCLVLWLLVLASALALSYCR